MKRFVDLHLRPMISDPNQVKNMITKSYELGYRLVGISLPPDAPGHTIRQLQQICSEVGTDLVTRVDLALRTSKELLGELRRLRRRFEVVSALCASKSVARQAAKDRRVDLLSFPADPRRRFFDPAEGELASKALASLEIDMAPLLSLRGGLRVRLFSRLRREVEVANKFKVPIVLSSGATKEYFLRTPHDYAALASLFDLPPSLGLRALSDNPLAIVERNRGKLSPGYVAPGIRVIKEGKDCLGE